MSSYYHIGSRIDHLSCEILLVCTGLKGIFITPVRAHDDDIGDKICQSDILKHFGVYGIEVYDS